MYGSILKSIITTLVILFIGIGSLFAQVWVDGYYRKDGTYVKGHYRTKPDGNPYNNYSYPGNYNPNTGKITGGRIETYLRNYYDYFIDLSNYKAFDVELHSSTNYYNSTSLNKIKEIVIVQKSLKIIGYNPGPIDGILGQKTRSALREFQDDYGIYISGYITDKTLNALLEELSEIINRNSDIYFQTYKNEWLSGVWTGIGYQFDNDISWNMQVSISDSGNFVNYSNPKCSAKWIFKNIVGEKIIFHEELISGFTECANHGRVILKKVQENKIMYKFYYQNSNDFAAFSFLSKN